MKRSFLSVLAILFILFSITAIGQSTQHSQPEHGPSPVPTPDAAMHDMPDMPHGLTHKQPMTFIDEILHHDTAGTSAQPNSTNEPMIMRLRGKWMFMFHGTAFLNAIQ